MTYTVMFGDMSISEPIVSTQLPWQALWAIDGLSKVAPDIEVRLRINDGDRPSWNVSLAVKQGRWRCPGVSKLQQEAA